MRLQPRTSIVSRGPESCRCGLSCALAVHSICWMHLRVKVRHFLSWMLIGVSGKCPQYCIALISSRDVHDIGSLLDWPRMIRCTVFGLQSNQKGCNSNRETGSQGEVRTQGKEWRTSLLEGDDNEIRLEGWEIDCRYRTSTTLYLESNFAHSSETKTYPKQKASCISSPLLCFAQSHTHTQYSFLSSDLFDPGPRNAKRLPCKSKTFISE